MTIRNPLTEGNPRNSQKDNIASPPVIKSITVLEGGRGMDTVFIEYDAPDPVWPYTGTLEARFTVVKGNGVLYVKAIFGIEPIVIDMNEE